MIKKWIGILLCGCLSALTVSCSFGDEPSLCPYNTRLEYWYAGSSTDNVLPTYVDNLKQYLFDQDGNLLETLTLRNDSVKEWKTDLPPGDYMVVVWGNLENGSKDSVSVLPPGEKKMSNLTLSAVTEGVPPGYRANTGRLYYGTTTFTVAEGEVMRKRVYLSHAHAVLNVTVEWRGNERPPSDGTFKMYLKGVPAIYGFVKGWEMDIPSGDGVYAVPWISSTVTNHETRAVMNYDSEVIGEFVTFRYTASTHPAWSLWRNGVQIVKELDLYKFFQSLPMKMNENIEQEFDIVISIYDDRIVVALASGSDWDEGGVIG